MARRLILASRSPRRRHLLEMLGLPIEVVPADVEEVRGPGESPVEYVTRLAREKALAVPGDWVLGADTTVALGDRILEKPGDQAEAVAMLLELQGRSHTVITAVALQHGGEVRTAADLTTVTFRPADSELLARYAATGEPLDKAGAYGIQGYGAALVDRIEGDFFSVMGLPIRLALDLLEQAGWRYDFTR